MSDHVSFGFFFLFKAAMPPRAIFDYALVFPCSRQTNGAWFTVETSPPKQKAGALQKISEPLEQS